MESWKRFPYSGLLGIHRWAMESRHKKDGKAAVCLAKLLSKLLNKQSSSIVAGDLRRHDQSS